jgi:hypothetical protein
VENGLRNKWLEYAWDVVSSSGSVAQHRHECIRLGGAFSGETCKPGDATLRYPGYFGKHYENGRILLIGAVHNGNALFTESFRSVEDATSVWRSTARLPSPDSDDNYLDRLRSGYGAAMPAWGPLRRFGNVLEVLNLGLSSAVYMNVAKCWSYPRKPSTIGAGKQDDLLMEFCSVESAYDIGRLVGLLDPLQIYVSARNVYDAVALWSNWVIARERVWVFDGNTGDLFQGNEHQRELADAAHQYGTLTGGRSL